MDMEYGYGIRSTRRVFHAGSICPAMLLRGSPSHLLRRHEGRRMACLSDSGMDFLQIRAFLPTGLVCWMIIKIIKL